MQDRSVGIVARPPCGGRVGDTHRTGFTLVEMLVVIAIIAMLAGLVTGAAVMARIYAKRAVLTMEIKQLDMACQMYKEKFGEYPPDFSDVTAPGQAIIMRHLAKAFPRYQAGFTQGGGPTNDWTGFRADVLAGTSSKIDINNLTPASALTFWLGGVPTWNGATLSGFTGFSANPLNPFENSTTTSSRLNKFYDFALTQTLSFSNQLMYYPAGVTSPAPSATNPYVYFRAENSFYTVDGTQSGTMKVYASGGTNYVVPAADSRISTTSPYTWVNPQSFQIFCAGLDATYAAPSAAGTPLLFPSGANYQNATFDDQTNFSNGTLENSKP